MKSIIEHEATFQKHFRHGGGAETWSLKKGEIQTLEALEIWL